MKDITEDNRESGTINFVKVLFNMVCYVDVRDVTQRRVVVCWLKQYHLVASQGGPQVDACIMENNTCTLLVVKVNKHSRGFDSEPRLISDAIAAFHNDNIMRAEYRVTNPLTSKVMPGIVMDDTMPTFYKTPIIAELVRAVESGEKPEQETVVHACVLEVPRPEEGMKPLDNRYIFLSCFELFRKFL